MSKKAAITALHRIKRGDGSGITGVFLFFDCLIVMRLGGVGVLVHIVRGDLRQYLIGFLLLRQCSVEKPYRLTF
ncbi:MAG: hypothetical protein WBE90_14570 [Xanthobacteraceae bacterium]